MALKSTICPHQYGIDALVVFGPFYGDGNYAKGREFDSFKSE